MNVLTTAASGSILFDSGTAGGSTHTHLSAAAELSYDGTGGIDITSHVPGETDRFNVRGAGGTLFSVNDALTGTVFSVNDASGLPIIEVNSNATTDTIAIGEYGTNALFVSGGNVGVGTVTPTVKLDVSTTGANGINLSKDTGTSTISTRLFFSNATAGQGVSIYNSSANMMFQTGSTAGSTTGSTRMVINSAGRVGIGTTAPSSLLHLENAVSPTLQIKDTTNNVTLKAFSQDSNAHLGTFSNHPLAFDTNSSERMRITSAGYVGIGTSSPENKLHILTSTSDTSSQLMVQNSSSGDAAIKFNIDGQSNVIGIDNSDGNKFKISGASALGTTDRLTIDTSGNVGIGTTSPAKKLHVNGSYKLGTNAYIQYDGAYPYTINIENTASAGDIKLQSANGENKILLQPSTGGIDFHTNNSESMRITDAGNVGIGTTTPDEFSIGNAYRYLAIGGDKTGVLNLIDDGTNGSYLQFGTAAGLRRSSIHTLNGSHLVFAVNNSNSGVNLTEAMRIASNGNVGIGTTAPGTKLEIDQSANTYASGLSLRNAGNVIYGMFVDGSNNLNFHYQGSSKVVFESGGNVGIGTTSAARPLTINSDTSHRAIRILENDSANESWDIGVDVDGDLNFFNSADSSPTVVFSDSGNVGIGTTSPSDKLDVVGDDAKIFLQSADYKIARIQPRGVGANLDKGLFSLFDGSTEDVRIDTAGSSWFNGGNIGINQGSPAEKLDVCGHIQAKDAGVLAGVNGNKDGFIFHDLYTGSGNYYGYKAFSSPARLSIVTDGAEGLTVNANTKVGIGCTTPTQKLAVAGDGLFTSNLTVQGSLSVTGAFTCLETTISVTSALSVQNDGTGPALIVNQTGSNDIVDFRDDGTSAFYIEDGGNVGIGTTNPTKKLHVEDSSGYQLQLDGGAHFWNVGAGFSGYHSGSFLIANTTGDKFTIDANGKVGIGTTSPSEKLHVSTGHLRLDTGYSLQWSDSHERIEQSDGHLEFFVNNTESMTLDTNGLGIGTTSPDHKLHVKGDVTIDNESSSVPSMLHFNATNKSNLDPTARINFWEGDQHGNNYTTSNAFIEYNGSGAGGGDGYLAIGGATTAGSNQDIMVLNRLGRVGIGAAVPKGKLHVLDGTAGSYTPDSEADTVVIESSVAGGISLIGSGSGSAQKQKLVFGNTSDPTGAEVRYDPNNSFMSVGTTAASNYLKLITGNGTEAMRLAADGKVGIGTTSPSNTLEISNTSFANQLRVLRPQNTEGGIAGVINIAGTNSASAVKDYARIGVIIDDNTNATEDGSLVLQTITNGTNTEKMRINSSGDVGIGGTSAGAKLEIHQAQVTTQFDRDPFLRLHPTATTNSGGFTNIMFGTSPVNNFGVAIGGLRAGTDGTPSFSIRMLNDDIAGTEVLRILNSGNVGIGTTSPSEKLHVVGTNIRLDSNAGGFYKYTGGGGFRFALLDDSSKTHLFADGDGSNPHMTFNAGFVGIATENPTSPLTIKSSSVSASDSALTIQGNSNTNAIVKIAERSTDGARFHMYDGGVEKIAFYTDGTANHISAGNVGIGTTSPSAKLDVSITSGNAWMNLINGSETNFRLTTYNNGTGNGSNAYAFKHGLYYSTTENAAVTFYRGGSSTGGFLTFTTNAGSERMRIDSLGDVIMGNTAVNIASNFNNQKGFGFDFSTGQTEIATTANAPTLTLGRNLATDGSILDLRKQATVIGSFGSNTTGGQTLLDISASASNGNMRFLTSGAERIRITSTGNVGIGTASPDSFNSEANNLVVGTGSGVNGITINAGTTSSAALMFADGTSGTEAYRGFIQYRHAEDGFRFGTAGGAKMCLDSGGKLGVNTLAPNATLTVAGQLSARSFCASDSLHNSFWGNVTISNITTASTNTAIGYNSLRSLTSGNWNVAIGSHPLEYNTTGRSNIALGYLPLNKNTTGCCNIALGLQALYNNTTGSSNIAMGIYSLLDNTTGSCNTGLGYFTLKSNTTGHCNVAIGKEAMLGNTTGGCNVALGPYALRYNTTGVHNYAVGNLSMQCSLSGNHNTAIGQQSLAYNYGGCCNAAIGYLALEKNTVGDKNFAVGPETMRCNTTGQKNIALGDAALCKNTTGVNNIAIGSESSRSALSANYNTAIGQQALYSNYGGACNTSIGYISMQCNTTGGSNVAIGPQTMRCNTTGGCNTAIGPLAMYCNTTGGCNTAIGFQALYHNTTGYHNTAITQYALAYNTTGTRNTAIGYVAMYRNTTGAYNFAAGSQAMQCNTTGNYNTAIGENALRGAASSSGSYNFAVGQAAMIGITTGAHNTALGYIALCSNTTGASNVGIGINSLCANTTGSCNVAIGPSALCNNTTGGCNVAIGRLPMVNNTTGHDNVALGHQTLVNNTTGNYNFGSGFLALAHNTEGDQNTAIGYYALYCNTTGTRNIAIGAAPLEKNTTGSYNVALGYRTLNQNTTGSNNVAFGCDTLLCNTTGACNTAIGKLALCTNTTGSFNTAIGNEALQDSTTGSHNTAIGCTALQNNTTGGLNFAVGNNALGSATTASSNIAIGGCALKSTVSSGNNVALGLFALCNTTAVNNIGIGESGGKGITSGIRNLALGQEALGQNAVTTGNNNVAIGFRSLANTCAGNNNTGIGFATLCSNTTGAGNVALGEYALKSNTSGADSVMIGYNAGCGFTTATNNIGIGCQALKGSGTSTGSNNVAIGKCSQYNVSSGTENLAIGAQTLQCNQTGARNVAIGSTSGFRITGSDNLVFGRAAGCGITSGSTNVAIGNYAMRITANNGTSSDNVAIGNQALKTVTSGSKNIALGFCANQNGTTGGCNISIGACAHATGALNGTRNIALGEATMWKTTSGNNNIAMGFVALGCNTTGSCNIAIGYQAGRFTGTGTTQMTSPNNSIFIGNDSTGGGGASSCNEIVIGFGAVGCGNNKAMIGNSSLTHVCSNGTFSTVSDIRDKTCICDLEFGLDFIGNLKPKTFNMITDRSDPEGSISCKRHGFIAQDVLALEGEDSVIVSTDNPNQLGYTGEHIIPILVKGMQEQQAVIDNLTARLEALEG